MTQKRKPTEIQLDWPLWYHPENPVGSALRYLASLSPQFQWIGIFLVRGKSMVLGPSLGKTPEEAFSKWVTPIKNSKDQPVGQIEIQHFDRPAINAAEREAVQKVAIELGQLWSTKFNRIGRNG